jgi:hypothetical protein
MGWNSWNTFGCTIDERVIRDSADAMVTSGMAAAGYTVKNLWSNAVRSSGGTVRAQVQPHDAAMFRITPGAAADVPPLLTVAAEPAAPYVTSAGQVDVQVKVYNDGTAAVTSARLALGTPDWWEAVPAGSTEVVGIPAGQNGSATWHLAADRPDLGAVNLTPSASWIWNQAA